MGYTPDDLEGGLEDADKLLLRDNGETADAEGEVVYRNGFWELRDSEGVFVPLSPERHKALQDLIHFIPEGPTDGFASGSFEEILPAGDPFPTSDIWYTDNTKAKKIVENTTTYNANKTINVDTWKMYDTDGTTVLITLLDTYVYSGGVFPYQITRTWS